MCIQNNYIMENHLMTSIKITKPNGQNNYLKQWQKANFKLNDHVPWLHLFPF